MRLKMEGLQDFATFFANERKLGGAIEAEQIRLMSGEQFNHPVFISFSHGTVGFHSEHGQRYIVNLQEVSLISGPVHKPIQSLCNDSYRLAKTEQKLSYLRRLCELNEGNTSEPFKDEVTSILDDIGMEAAAAIAKLLPIAPEEPKSIARIRIA